jgi:hypothetical protein
MNNPSLAHASHAPAESAAPHVLWSYDEHEDEDEDEANYDDDEDEGIVLARHGSWASHPSFGAKQ